MNIDADLFTGSASLSGIYLHELVTSYQGRYHPDSVAHLLLPHFIDPDRLATDPTYRVPLYHAFQLLAQVAEAENDPLIALRLLQDLRPRAFQFVGYAITSCRTLREAALALAKYEALVWGAGSISLVERGAMAHLIWAPLLPVPEAVIEMAIAGWVKISRHLVPQLSAPAEPLTHAESALRVCFTHPVRGSAMSDYHDLFGCVVSFEQTANEIIFPVEWLDLRPLDADPVLLSWAQEKIDGLLKDYAVEVNLSCELRAFLLSHLDSPALGLDTFAQQLGLSTRALRHALARHGINFRVELDHARKERALQLIRAEVGGDSPPLTHIALECGFSEQSAFNRAFKRWTGATPGDYLQALTEGNLS